MEWTWQPHIFENSSLGPTGNCMVSGILCIQVLHLTHSLSEIKVFVNPQTQSPHSQFSKYL